MHWILNLTNYNFRMKTRIQQKSYYWFNFCFILTIYLKISKTSSLQFLTVLKIRKVQGHSKPVEFQKHYISKTKDNTLKKTHKPFFFVFHQTFFNKLFTFYTFT